MKSQKPLYYFGYGANMSKEYLQNRRRVFPTETFPGTLKGYRLIMNMEGPNFIEPSFANIIEAPNESIEGILNRITEKELNRIVNSEGVNYELVDININVGEKQYKAKTLIYKTNKLVSTPPSKRYMKILINAAVNNNLSVSYIEKLKKNPSVYYPVLSEIFSIIIFYWVRKRSKKSM